MFLLKLMRKFGKLLRGGAADRQIFLGGLLGVIIGMIPGFNLTLVLAILVLLLLNAHVGIALLGFALGKVLCLLLAPWTFEIGYAVIHGIGLEGLFRTLSDTPVVALLDLHVYSLLGGLPIALALGALFGWLMGRAVRYLRLGIFEATQRSARIQRLAQNKAVRVFLWLVFGGRKADMEDMLQTSPPLLRKSGLILTGAVLAVVVVVELIALDYVVKLGVERGMGYANGAEVNLKEADLSLTGGRLSLRGLQATDAGDPARNAFQAERLEADLGVSDLLRKRYVINLLDVRNVAFDTERETPGEVYRKPEPVEPEPGEPGVPLEDYFKKAQKAKEYLDKLNEWLERRRAEAKREERERREKKRLVELGKNRSYLALSAKELIARRPVLVIRKLNVEGISLPLTGAAQNVTGSNLTSHPTRLGEEMSLTVTPAEGGESTAALAFGFHQPEPVHRAAFRFEGVPLSAASLSDDAPFQVKQGTADIELKGTFTADRLDMPFKIALKDLQATSREGEGFLGLDPEQSRTLLENLTSLTFSGRLGGRPGAPTVEINPSEVLAAMQESLMRAGKEQVARIAGQQIEQVSDRLKKELGGQVEGELGDELKKKLPGFGGQEEEETPEGEEAPEDEEKEEKKRPEDMLKDLF